MSNQRIPHRPGRRRLRLFHACMICGKRVNGGTRIKCDECNAFMRYLVDLHRPDDGDYSRQRMEDAERARRVDYYASRASFGAALFPHPDD